MRFIILGIIIAMIASVTIFAQKANSAETLQSTISGKLTHPICPDQLKATYSMTYPETGNPLQDLIIKNFSMYRIASFLYIDVNSHFDNPRLCDENSFRLWLTYDSVGTITKASKDYLSMFFTTITFFGGNQDTTEYLVMNFKKDGYVMDLSDLFPDKERSLPLYFDLVYSITCKAGFDTTPSYFGSEECGGRPNGQTYLSNNINTIASLGNLSFNPEGATIHLESYNCWTRLDGSFDFQLSKADLIAIGANPAIWGD
ncbi:MAG: hypothetical protein LBE38_05420 [Deltaproteobacteria bacterium]|jgi:hypothetical protein|nr:hypothetical protein [Deltaproteobacteria bacterium]